MKISKNNKTIIINNSQSQYLSDIQKYFDEYFDAIDTVSNVLDFSMPKQFLLKEWGWNVWLPSFTESIKELQKYTKYLDIKEGDVVIDAGGYAGITSMIFANIVGKSGKVITVEPDPINIQCIKNNFDNYKKINGYSPILIEGAIWDFDGKISFSSESAMGSAATEYVGRRGNIVTIDCFKLSTIANNYKKIDHIKMDIESAELKAINDIDFFNKYHPSIIMECHIPNTYKNIIKPKLENYGYIVEQIMQNESPFEMLVAKHDG
jgi:FkbM family methyltransferase